MVMTRVMRRALMVVVAVGASSGTAGCGTSGIPSAAQYAAMADNVCEGVPAKEREKGLLAYRDAIVGIAPLKQDTITGKFKARRTEGVAIGLRALPDVSVPWLERVNLCHVALVGSGRLVDNEIASDPFAIPGATVGATEVYAGYVLSVKGMNRTMAQEILRRSSVLRSERTGSATASNGSL
jgi:hypothetical protein